MSGDDHLVDNPTLTALRSEHLPVRWLHGKHTIMDIGGRLED
jgi:hypothetical protein